MVEIKIKVGSEKGKPGFLAKITHFVFGIFITTMIFAISMQLFRTRGIFIGCLLAIIASFFTYTKSQPHSFFRRIAWGMILSSITLIASYFVLLQVFESSFEGFNS